MEINNLLNTPLFGVTISIIAYFIGVYIFDRTKLTLLNPLLVGSILIISILAFFRIDLTTYQVGGDLITFLIGPATVALAIPLYKNINYLKRRLPSILIGILVGAGAGLLTVIGLGKLLNLDMAIIKSLLPKSTTAAIGLSISEYNEGIVELTSIFIILTGIVGSMIARQLFKIIKIDDRVAKGISLGATSHVMGTSEALEIGEVEGALASVGLSLAGIFTVILVPFFIKWFL